MKKWQIWTIVGLVTVIVLAGVGGMAYYLTREAAKKPPVPQLPAVEGEAELSEAQRVLGEAAQLDLTELERAGEELRRIDLSGL